MTASVPTRTWRSTLAFGIAFCIFGTIETVASVLSLQSHSGSRQILDWVLLAASVLFFLAGVASIVTALVRRRASGDDADSDQK